MDVKLVETKYGVWKRKRCLCGYYYSVFICKPTVKIDFSTSINILKLRDDSLEDDITGFIFILNKGNKISREAINLFSDTITDKRVYKIAFLVRGSSDRFIKVMNFLYSSRNIKKSKPFIKYFLSLKDSEQWICSIDC